MDGDRGKGFDETGITFVPTAGSAIGGMMKEKTARITDAMTDLQLGIDGLRSQLPGANDRKRWTRPSVAHEHTVVVGPEHGGGIGESAAGADGVDGRVRRGERPEPVGDGADAPAGFVGRDHGRVAHLLAQLGVGRPGVAGGAVQQVGQAARRHLQVEVPPQQVGDLRQRHAHLRVQLDDQRDDAGAELRRGGAQPIGGLQGVAALHAPPTLRAVPDLDIELAHEGAHLGQVLLILPRGAGHFDRAAAVRARRGDRGCVGFIDPSRPRTASVPAVLRTGPPAGTLPVTLRAVLGEGRRLPAAGAPHGLQLLFQVVRLALQPVVLTLQPVVLALQAVVLALKFRDARVARIALWPGRERAAASALLPSHTSAIGTSAPDLHSTSRIFSPLPANQRQIDEMPPGEHSHRVAMDAFMEYKRAFGGGEE